MTSSTASVRILLVDDYEDWRKQVRSLLQVRAEWQVVCEVADGVEAIEMAGVLKPDLVVLDISLPKLNGIEAARRIQQVAPNSKIVFLTTDNSPDIEQAALSTGAHGFVHKARAQDALWPAIDAVLRGEFVTSKSGGIKATEDIAHMSFRQLGERFEWLHAELQRVDGPMQRRLILARMRSTLDAMLVQHRQSLNSQTVELNNSQRIDLDRKKQLLRDTA